VGPTVSITTPANGATFSEPASVTLAVDATDPDYPITMVKFFQGAVLISQDSSLPYQFTRSGLPAGHYTFTAEATNSKGRAVTSSPVDIVVNAPGNASPTVSLTAPANNATFTAPATVNLAATANDSDGTVSKVEFFNGNNKLGEDASSPYTWAWNGVVAGSYVITAKATDNDGAVKMSAPVNIDVNPAGNAPPSVSLTAPANNAAFTAPANIHLAATAADTDGRVAKVEFFHGNTKIGQATSSPFTFDWNAVAAGHYVIAAKATDSGGAVATSASVTITVNAPANIPPAVTLTSPSNNETFAAAAPINLSATANDADGTVNKVEFFQNEIKIGEDTSLPFTFTWLNVPAGTYLITAKATDNQGASNTSAPIAIQVTPAAVQPPPPADTQPGSSHLFLPSKGPLRIPLPSGGHVTAYAANGAVARSWDVPSGGTLEWDGRNTTGTDVASGVYWFVVSSGGSFKIVVVR
jgi:hypothetical protein